MADPRVLTREQVATYCAIGVATVNDWVARGLIPGPMPGTFRWDRENIDRYLDTASGIVRQSETEIDHENIVREISDGL